VYIKTYLYPLLRWTNSVTPAHVNKIHIVICVTYIRSGLNFRSFYDAVNIQDCIVNNELERILEESGYCLIEVPSWHIPEGTDRTKTGIKVASVLAEIQTQHLLNKCKRVTTTPNCLVYIRSRVLEWK
jgi:hypothetical protein